MMDVPRRYSWVELKQLAANRDFWMLRVKALREDSGVKVTINGPPPSPHKWKANPLTALAANADITSSSTNDTTTTKAAKHYRERDTHEEFFRSSSKSTRKRRRGARRIKPKRHVLTNKERRRAVREHWDLHHDFDLDMPEMSDHQNIDRQFTNPNLIMM